VGTQLIKPRALPIPVPQEPCPLPPVRMLLLLLLPPYSLSGMGVAPRSTPPSWGLSKCSWGTPGWALPVPFSLAAGAGSCCCRPCSVPGAHPPCLCSLSPHPVCPRATMGRGYLWCAKTVHNRPMPPNTTTHHRSESCHSSKASFSHPHTCFIRLQAGAGVGQDGSRVSQPSGERVSGEMSGE